MSAELKGIARAVRDKLDAKAVYVLTVNADGTVDAAMCSDAWTYEAMEATLKQGSAQMLKVIEQVATTQRQVRQN